MKNKSGLIKILIFIAAYIFLFFKIKNYDFSFIATLHPPLIIAVSFLMIINWMLESKKWQIILHAIHKKVSFFQAVKSVITGLSAGVITPNRIGEYAGRSMVGNNRHERTEIFLASLLSSAVQSTITFIAGLPAYWYVAQSYGNIMVSIEVAVIYLILVAIIFLVKKNEAKKLFALFQKQSLSFFFRIFGLSAIRFLIFAIQLFLIFQAFNYHPSFQNSFMALSAMYFMVMFIPSIFWAEPGIRGSTAAYIFPLWGINGKISVVAVSILWLVNVALPVAIGGIIILTTKNKER